MRCFCHCSLGVTVHRLWNIVRSGGKRLWRELSIISRRETYQFMKKILKIYLDFLDAFGSLCLEPNGIKQNTWANGLCVRISQPVFAKNVLRSCWPFPCINAATSLAVARRDNFYPFSPQKARQWLIFNPNISFRPYFLPPCDSLPSGSLSSSARHIT